MTEDPAEIVRRALLAINSGDEELFLESLDTNVEWNSHLDGLLPAGDWRGREGVRMGRAAAGRHIRTTMHGLDVQGDRVMVLGVVTLEETQFGRSSTPIHWVWTIRDGLAVRVESFRSRTAAEAALARR